MSERAWAELAALSQCLDRMRSELFRCNGHTKYRDDLVGHIRDGEKRRAELVALLCAAVPEGVANQGAAPAM